MKRENVILIGMPASGKSTVGVVLAKMMGYDFVDTDLLIQRQGGCRLEEMIRKQGMQGFLETEERVCCAVNTVNTVIATGGSAVYSAEAMEHFRSIGTVIYLEVDLDTLKERLQDIHARGVVLRPDQTFEELYEERTLLYRKNADYTVQEGKLSLEETAEAAYALVRSK